MSHIVSLIGPTATGKTSFATWFVDRNPLYKHIDIAKIRTQYGVLSNTNDTNKRLQAEEQTWQYMEQLIYKSQYTLLESTGLLYRLQPIYNNSSSICTIKLLSNIKDLTTRIIKRNNPNSDLELMYLEQDYHEISQLKTDIVCMNLTPDHYTQLEDKIFMLMLEQNTSI